MMNSILGLVGESFGYTVLDKVGIVFAASLVPILDTAIIATLTPLVMATLLHDPLLAWKVPSYIIYSLFLGVAFSLIQGRLEKLGPRHILIPVLFLSSGVFLLSSPELGIKIAGISLTGFGLFLLAISFLPVFTQVRIPPQTLGAIMLLVAPPALVIIDLTLYSTLFVDVFSGTMLELVKTTIYLMIIDSAGPLILYGIVWLALDLETVLSSVKGKINYKRQAFGLALLLIIVAPIALVGGFYMLSPERKVHECIKNFLPGDWSIHEMRMSYVWSPLGVSGTVFITYPTQHIYEDSYWYQAGINLYLIRSAKKIIDLKTGDCDLTLLQEIISLQFLAWLIMQGIRHFEPTVTLYKVGKYQASQTARMYLNLNSTMRTISDFGPRVELKLLCYVFVTNIEEYDLTGMIVLYGVEENFKYIESDLMNFVNNFNWTETYIL
ncbi:MAG: hypothetical protein QXH55_03900 [Candidatus Korarchaeota archaeon]|nr:hypothetical protein [Thermoproteota archaeon]MCR8463370.1 hypothetical protein [Thermoproteota archaeon]MCR8471430.1 hypothetical protein [Thermoproteota archaeon]MCR8488029.1 hypothetical protein [Thermoproteota archaeon]MCR8500964.1 hypothetical protein [Thermoproteota archaeon]